jgi:hypothetical protein
MSQPGRICTFVVVAVGWSVSTVFAQDKVDNPDYMHWTQFKVGSFSQTRATNVIAGEKGETIVTVTLKELTPEKAIVEVKTVDAAAGRKAAETTRQVGFPAKIEKAKLRVEPKEKGKLPDGREVLDIKQGAEELEVAGQKIKTNWTETKIKHESLIITEKTWTSDDIPDRTVKTVSTTEGEMDSKSEVVLEKFKADKNSKAGKSADAEKNKDKKDAKPEAVAKDKETKKAPDEKAEKKDQKDGKDKK